MTDEDIQRIHEAMRCCATCLHGSRGRDLDVDERWCGMLDEYVAARYRCPFWTEG